MSRNHLLGALGASLLVIVALAGCGGESSPTPAPPSSPEPPISPLTSPVETPTVPPTPVPTLSRCADGCFEPSEGCIIKGAVTGMGDKYYYLPEMEGYNDAQLLPKYGGRWFCTEEEAIANDFQRAPE